jgi:hypothetical protein
MQYLKQLKSCTFVWVSIHRAMQRSASGSRLLSRLRKPDRRFTTSIPSPTSGFEKKFERAQLAAGANQNIWDQITCAFELCDDLNSLLDFGTYCDIHRKCLSYFGTLIANFRDATRFSVHDLQNAYRASSLCEKLISRIYVCLIVAFSFPDGAVARNVIEWTELVSNPVHRFMLHFTVISLYPVEFADSSTAIQNQFGRLADDVLRVLDAFPSAQDAICGWISSAIRVTLTASRQDSAVIGVIVRCANRNRGWEKVSGHVLLTLLHNLAADRMALALPEIAGFFLGSELTVAFRQVVLLFCEKATPGDAFLLLQDLPYGEALSDRLFQKAIDSKDIDAVERILRRWPCGKFLWPALMQLGSATFADICPPLSGQAGPLVQAFVEGLNESISMVRFRLILNSLLEEHTPLLEHNMGLLLSRVAFDEGYVEALFSAPFQFRTSELLEQVVSKMPFDRLADFVDRATAVSSEVRARLLCDGWQSGDGSLLLAHVHADFSDVDFARVIKVLGKADLTADEVSKVFERCPGGRSILAFIELLDGRADVDEMANQAVEKVLMTDGDLDLRQRIGLYLDVLRAVVQTDLAFREETVRSVLEIVVAIVEKTRGLSMFPLASREQIGQWNGRLDWEWGTANYARYRSEVEDVRKYLRELYCR